MITFSRGLVLRRGERALEFMRDLGDGRVQFEYQDNRESCTMRLSKVYGDVLAGRLIAVVVSSASAAPASGIPPALVKLTLKQEHLIEFRLRFVLAVLRSPSRHLSREHCGEVVKQVWGDEARAQKSGLGPEKLACPSASTVVNWVRRYLHADRNAVALIDRRAMSARPRRLNLAVESIVDQLIAKFYLQIKGVSVKETYRRICTHIQRHNQLHGEDLFLPSERTLNRRVLSIPPYIRDYKRGGPAYARNKWRYSLAGDQSTRILERVEIDHTLLDIWVLDPRSGVPLGRPWITLLIDRYSGYLLGFYISFYGPSSATVARAMKVAILPKDDWVDSLGLGNDALPWTAMGVAECYVVDNGLEFHSATFLRLAWELRSDLIFNPVRQPWMKAAIERAVMETNRTLPLKGRVHTPAKNAVTPDPGQSAAILFDDLCYALLEWASQKFPRQIHTKTLCRPLDLWEEGREAMPPVMLPSSMDGLDLLCGLNAQRRVDGDGVSFQYLRFNSIELQDYRRTHGTSFTTEIRFNPDDLRVIHVLLPKAKQWLSVPLQRPSLVGGQSLSLVQLQVIRAEAGKKLARANAYEELERAEVRLRERWENATRRGLRMRRDAKLVRLQGLTSVPLDLDGPQARSSVTAAPLELSPMMAQSLPDLAPFSSFAMEEF